LSSILPIPSIDLQNTHKSMVLTMKGYHDDQSLIGHHGGHCLLY